MNSDDRRKARRARRDAERAARRAKRQEALTFEAVCDLDNLHEAAMIARRGVSWKASVQRYMKDELRNIAKAKHQLERGESVLRGAHEFDLMERGKLRHITSVHISERVVHKCLSRQVLVPALSASFIRNNTANTKGRGNTDAIARLKRDLVRHYRRHGGDGYILLIDVRSYFASITHDGAYKLVERAVDDPSCLALAKEFIGPSGECGLGLGSEPNQICAVAYPGRVNHYVTEVLRLPYGRYMDDSYVIAPTKEELYEALEQIRCMYAGLWLELNAKKTRIVKLSKGFTWLKKRWSYGPTGRVVVRPSRDSITSERRKLKAHARLVAAGEMDLAQAQQSYQSWRGSMCRLDAHGAVLRMDALWRELFG